MQPYAKCALAKPIKGPKDVGSFAINAALMAASATAPIPRKLPFQCDMKHSESSTTKRDGRLENEPRIRHNTTAVTHERKSEEYARHPYRSPNTTTGQARAFFNTFFAPLNFSIVVATNEEKKIDTTTVKDHINVPRRNP
jgi:hypothetical protein|eukprot:g13005.t1 g13005   contig7:654305-654724(-)